MSSNSRLVKVYVGHAVTDATQEFLAVTQRFKDAIKASGMCEFLCFKSGETANCSDADVTAWCLGHCVPTCHLMVAVVDESSTTLGIEVDRTLGLNKPVLALAQRGRKISRVIQSLSTISPRFDLVRYRNLETDGLDVVFGRISRLHRAMRAGTLPFAAGEREAA